MQSFPRPGHKVRVSSEGVFPGAWWTRDGRELLFFGSDRALWRAGLQAGPALSVSEPRRIAPFPVDSVWVSATPDLQRFLALLPERRGTGSITMTQNWKTALEKRR